MIDSLPRLSNPPTDSCRRIRQVYTPGRAAIVRLIALFLIGALIPERPAFANNILLIIADDLGASKLGSFSGHAPGVRTPHLDRLASEGVRFQSTWANPLCSPTRALLMTGRYGFRTGVTSAIQFQGSNSLGVREVTLPEILHEAGYSCGLFGKWHLGINSFQGGVRAPNVAGWNHFSGVLGGGVSNYSRWPHTTNGVTRENRGYITSVLVNDFLNWAGRQRGKPWFACLAFNAPHTPLHVPPSNLHTGDLRGLNPRVDPLPFFNAMLEAMDTEIGRCVASLQASSPGTTIIFLGDNGTAGIAANPDENPLRLKGTVYQGGVHVPLFIHGPRVQQPGRDVPHLAHAVDLFATIIELAGVPLPGNIDSTSLVPYLIDPMAPPQRLYLFAETSIDPFPCDSTRVGCQRAIRGERFKLIQNIGSRTGNDRDGPSDLELYDLIQDPRETNNLLEGVEFPEHEAAFEDLWIRLRQHHAVPEPIPDSRPFERGQRR